MLAASVPLLRFGITVEVIEAHVLGQFRQGFACAGEYRIGIVQHCLHRVVAVGVRGHGQEFLLHGLHRRMGFAVSEQQEAPEGQHAHNCCCSYAYVLL